MNRIEEFKLNLKNTVIQKYTVKWVAYWLTIMGIYIYLMKPNGINQLNSFEISSTYYFLSGLMGLYFFYPRNELHYFTERRLQLAFILCSAFIFTGMIEVLRHLTELDQGMKDNLSSLQFYFPFFELSTSITKLADIFFQQSLILSLVLTLKKHCDSKRVAVSLFTLIFFLLHIPLFLNFGLTALIFILPSLFAGSIFSTLILNSTHGLLHSFLVHEFFYIILGVIIRLV